MKKGTLFLAAAAGLCFTGFDVIGIIVAGVGVYTGNLEVK